MDDLFHFFSRLVIVIPIVIIILALVLKFNQKESNYYPKITPQLTVTPKETRVTSPSIKFDLIGPFVCQINEKQASISAYIKNKQIFISKREEKKTDYFLLQGDCLYHWEKGGYSGEKICGLSNYLSYFQYLTDFGFLRMGNLPINNLSALIKNCRKEKIDDENIFKVPANILFKNSPLKNLLPQ